jgi:hypothetical protein
MDNETKVIFAGIEVQLRRIAYILEVAESNRHAMPLNDPCVSCGCAFVPLLAPTCPICRTKRKEADGSEAG